MAKLFAIIMVVCVGLFAMISFISCDEEKTDYTGLMVLLAAAGQSTGGPNIYLFEAASAHNGDFDTNDNGNAREELDALAQSVYAASFSDLGCTEIHAFISVSGSDEIRDMLPKGKPVYGPTGSLIANDKTDLLDGSIARSLSTAEVTSSANYWTGSSQAGADYGINCSGWTSSSNISEPADWGEFGVTSNATIQWLAAGQQACINTYALLGVCW